MHDPRPPRSYFGYSQSPAKAQEALKEDEGEVEVEEDEGEERLFELAHEALGQREDEQELRKGQTDGRTDRHRVVAAPLELAEGPPQGRPGCMESPTAPTRPLVCPPP